MYDSPRNFLKTDTDKRNEEMLSYTLSKFVMILVMTEWCHAQLSSDEQRLG